MKEKGQKLYSKAENTQGSVRTKQKRGSWGPRLWACTPHQSVNKRIKCIGLGPSLCDIK